MGIRDFHEREAPAGPHFHEVFTWGSAETLQAIEDLPGPVVRCHLDATTANIVMTDDSHAVLIDDEYHAQAPAVFDFGCFLDKLARKAGLTLPKDLLPDMQ